MKRIADLQQAVAIWKKYHDTVDETLNRIMQREGELSSSSKSPGGSSSGDLKQSEAIFYEGMRKKISKIKQNKTIPINPDGQHDVSFKYFIHGDKTLVRSIDFIKINQAKKAFDEGSWSAEILRDPEIESILLTCFDKGYISFQQFATFLEMKQYEYDFGQIATFRILNENNEFTDDAKNVFFPSIEENSEVKLGDLDKENLRLLFASLPKSEQIFYTTNIDMSFLENKSFAFFDKLIKINAMFLNPDNPFNLVAPSTGVETAISIVKHGLELSVQTIHRLNRLSVREIESGVREEVRPTAITLSKQEPLKGIHNFNPPKSVTTQHDKAHARALSQIPKPYRKAYLHIADVIRVNLNQMHEDENVRRKVKQPTLMTSETWRFIDADFLSSPQTVSTYRKGLEGGFFSDSKKKSNLEFFGEIQNKDFPECPYSGLFNENEELTAVGMFVLLDMYVNFKQWESEYHIDINNAPPIFIKNFKLLSSIINNDSNFINDSPVKQALKVMLVQNLEHLESSKLSVPKLLARIDEYCELNNINDVCKFERIQKKDNSHMGNQVTLKIFSEHESALRDIIHGSSSEEITDQNSAWGCSIM